MRGIIITLLGLAAGCSYPKDDSAATPQALDPSQLTVRWIYKINYNDKFAQGFHSAETTAERESAFQAARNDKDSICATDTNCKTNAIT